LPATRPEYRIGYALMDNENAICDMKRSFLKPLMNGYDDSKGGQKAYNSLRFQNREKYSL
jgi:hypothetical protein